ncbi:root hair defective 3 GTP-binding protein, partial [Caulochytrium protostelioides]
MDDFFELQFFGIPHKVFAAEPFNQGCAQLRTWFMDPEHASYVFRPQFHKHIPADGFPAYAEAIWDKVLTNKDLDLPSQQELLAQFRCDEIAREALAGFTATVGPLHAPLESGQLVATLGETMQTALHTALTAFDKDASRYHKPVYTRRRADFRDQMVDQLHSLFTQYVRNLHQRTVQAFAAALLHAAKPPTVAHLFADALTKARAEAVDGWDQAVAAAMVDDVAWTTTEFRAQLETELNSITATRRRKVIDHL